MCPMDDELGKIHIVGSVTISYGRMYMHRKCLLIVLNHKHSMLVLALLIRASVHRVVEGSV